MQSASSQVLDPQGQRSVLTVLFIGVFMAALDAAVVAPAIPALKAAFAVDNSQIGMVTIIFSLFTLTSTTLMASLSDRHGRRPVYLLCVIGFALGSLLIALAPNFGLLLVGRAIQGFSAGGITPTASAMVGDAFPATERGKALGLIGATFGMAFLLGPLVASLILLVLSWQWIFLINLPIAALVLWMGIQRLPATRSTEPQPLDWAGITLVALVLSGLTLWPWLLATSLLGLIALVMVERRAVKPVVPLTLFTQRQLALTYTLCVGAGFGMSSVIFIASVAVAGLGIAPNQAGLLLIPLVIASSAGSVIFGRLLNSLGSRRVLLIGFGTLAVGAALLALTRPELGLWLFMPATMLIGLGVGIVVGGALRTIVLNEVSAEQRGAAQGLVNVGTSVGSLLVVASLGALADAMGGGMAGLSVAYLACAAVMVVMLLLCLGLKAHGEELAAMQVSKPSGA
jgi:MFS family permease